MVNTDKAVNTEEQSIVKFAFHTEQYRILYSGDMAVAVANSVSDSKPQEIAYAEGTWVRSRQSYF